MAASRVVVAGRGGGWLEEGEPLAEWTEPIVARGPRSAFEMEQIIPGADADDYENDPILQALDLENAGDRRGARGILMGCSARTGLALA